MLAEEEAIYKVLKLSNASWMYDRELCCHVPCCSFINETGRPCGNGPLTGNDILSGVCSIHTKPPCNCKEHIISTDNEGTYRLESDDGTLLGEKKFTTDEILEGQSAVKRWIDETMKEHHAIT